MKFSKAYYSLLLVFIVTAGGLAACSSGSSSSNSTNSQGSEKVTSGVITGFGSVFVNGVEYQTSNTTITINGNDATEDDLALGMVVNVKGTVDPNGTTGHASSIEYDDEIDGTVMSVNLTNGIGTIDVMGQTVNVDADTIFESHVADITSIDMLQAGNIVEVSGYSDGKGNIYASRVEVNQTSYTAGDVIEVKGMVSNLNTENMTFSLGKLTVDYSNADLMNFPDNTIANDLFVKVTSTTEVTNDTLVATQVTMINGENKHVSCKHGDEVELEGVVTTALNDKNVFMLNDQPVMVDDNTQYVNGIKADLKTGAKLEAEGKIDADKNLVASYVKFRMEATAKMFAPVEAVDTDANTITAMGLKMQVSTLTRIHDQQGTGMTSWMRYFSLSDIAVGDWVEVRYCKAADGHYVVTEIVRENAPADQMELLMGTVDEVTQAGLMVSGINVIDNSGSGIMFTAGQKVKVQGTYADNTLTATNIAVLE